MVKKSNLDEQLIDVDTLSKHIGLTKNWIYQRTRRREIPFIRCGRYCRFRLSQVIQWLEEQQK